MRTPDLQLFYCADGFAACTCPDCECVWQFLWWSPSQDGLWWSLYECLDCGAVTSVAEHHRLGWYP